MKPAAFEYICPKTVEAALAALVENKGDCKILAGGQSLVPAMNFRLARPGVLIDINELSELDFVRQDGDGLVIGSLSRHATFHRPVADTPMGHLLTKVVRNIAHYPIRQRGTFGGSLSHADPASEWCLVTQTLRADLVLRSMRGNRVVPASAFFKGTFTTALEEDEILAEIRFPAMPAGWASGFYEFSRRKGDFALAMALAALKIEGGVIRDVRLGVGGVSDHPLRLDTLEVALMDRPATPATFEAVAEQSRDVVEPTEDIHGSSAYRADLLVTVIKRALAEAAQ